MTGVDVAQFSPNGQYLAVGRQSESVVLWSLEDGKITHQFPHPPGKLSSLHFSPADDCLMAVFMKSHHKCLWRLDTQQMVSFDLDVEDIGPPAIHSSRTNHVFVSRSHTVEIWEVSTTGSNMVFEAEAYLIRSICPSRDGHRVLMGSFDGTVRMLNLEDLGRNQPVTQDDADRRHIIGFSPCGDMVATVALGSTYVELRDTATWELVRSRDIERTSQVVFSPDDNQIALVSESLVTIWDINHTETHLSFNPWPKGRSSLLSQAALQTRDDLVIYARLEDNNSNNISGLLQVWKLKDHSECIFSLDTDGFFDILLAPDGLTFITTNPTSCYSWNHNTVQFQPFHFANVAHLDGRRMTYSPNGGRMAYSPDGRRMVYSPDGKLFASCSSVDDNVRVWDTRTGQLCGKLITMFGVDAIALSPALNDRSLGDRLIALHCRSTETVSLLNVDTGHLSAQFCDPGLSKKLAFIRDGTKLVSYHPILSNDPIRIYNIANLVAKHQYEPVPRGTRDGWMDGKDNELLFWVPSEHRRVLCLPHAEMILERPTKVDLSHFKFGTKWTKCIDQRWLEEIKERGQQHGKLLG